MTDPPHSRSYLRPVWASLAALFVVLAALAGSVGRYAWQRVAALAWVERLGGVIEFEDLPEWVPERVAACWPDWARRIEVITLFGTIEADLGQLRMLRDAKRIDFFHAPVNDVQMRPLGSFDRLEFLQIDATNLTDAGVAPLSGCRSLQSLSMDMPWREDGKGIAVGDEGLQHLAGLPLEILGLSNTRVTDAGMDTLSRMQRLRELYLNGTPVTDAGLEKLRGLPLEMLYLSDTKVTDAGLATLGTMSRLDSIYLDTTEIGDAGLAALGTLPRLKILWIGHTRITNAGLVHLSRLPLEGLGLSYTAVDDEGLKHLEGLKTLDEVDLTGTKCTERGAKELAESLGLKLDRMHLK